MDHFQPVLALADLPPGASAKVTVNYQDLVLVMPPPIQLPEDM